MKRFIATMFVMAALTAGTNSPSFAADNAEKVDMKKPLTEAAFKKMTEAARPSEMHDKLYSMIGEWDYTITYKTAAAAESNVSTGKVFNEIVLDDSFLSIKADGIMNIGAHDMPYEGEGLIGYNNVTGQYSFVWADTTSSGLMSGEGTYNENNNTIVLKGQFTPPFAKKKQDYRTEISFAEDGSFTRKTITKDTSGKEFTMIEVVYSQPNS